jgi:hypothetical protein
VYVKRPCRCPRYIRQVSVDSMIYSICRVSILSRVHGFFLVGKSGNEFATHTKEK